MRACICACIIFLIRSTPDHLHAFSILFWEVSLAVAIIYMEVELLHRSNACPCTELSSMVGRPVRSALSCPRLMGRLWILIGGHLALVRLEVADS